MSKSNITIDLLERNPKYFFVDIYQHSMNLLNLKRKYAPEAPYMQFMSYAIIEMNQRLKLILNVILNYRWPIIFR